MEHKFKLRKNILNLAPRLSELIEQQESSKNEMTNQLLSGFFLPHKNFHKIFVGIEESKLTELRNSLYEYAVRYSRLRVDQLLVNAEQGKMLDEERTRKHNAFIDACNILSRNMIKNGEDAHWREELGNDRKMMGDFACYINYVLGIKAR
jgi:hypothetical protein